MSKPIDSQPLRAAARERMDAKAKPHGALGRLERLAAQIAGQVGEENPTLERCALLLFAADHGIAAAGVSAYPAEVTRMMLATFAEGRAAANVIAASVGATLQVVDAGVAGEPLRHPAVLDRRLGAGTANSIEGPAMTSHQLESALAHGRELAKAQTAPVLCFGEMGIGNTSAASLLGHKITGIPLTDVVGPGTGLDPAGVERKLAALEKASARTPCPLAPLDALREYGGFELAMMVGAMTGAAQARRVVIVDGFIATACTLAVVAMHPALADAFVYGHRSAEPGHAHLLAHLEAEPLLDLQLRLGEGTGALLAWPLVRSAAQLLTQMATLADVLAASENSPSGGEGT